MKPILMMLLILLLPIQQGSSELLTKQEIESAIGLKDSFTRAEVVDLVHGFLGIVEEEMKTTQDEVVQKNKNNIDQLKEVCHFQVSLVESERDFYKVVALVELGVCIAGAIIWAATK